MVVVTSRRQLTALAATDGARQVILDVLTGAEAHDLLAGRLGAGRLAAEPAAAEELAVPCARLPLALSIVAERASARPGLPLAALAAVLRDARGRLDVLDGGEAASVQAGQADALSGIGWHQCQLGDYTASIASCEQALEVYQQTGSRHQQGHTWDTLGRAHSQLGRHAEAAACYRHAVHILGELGNMYNTAEALIHASDAHEAAGDTSAARDALRQALALLNDLHHPDAAAARCCASFKMSMVGSVKSPV